MTYQEFQRRELLKNAAAYALASGIIVALLAGSVMLINQGNVRIEARCQDAGGQVLRAPGEVSRCLLPPTR